MCVYIYSLENPNYTPPLPKRLQWLSSHAAENPHSLQQSAWPCIVPPHHLDVFTSPTLHSVYEASKPASLNSAPFFEPLFPQTLSHLLQLFFFFNQMTPSVKYPWKLSAAPHHDRGVHQCCTPETGTTL